MKLTLEQRQIAKSMFFAVVFCFSYVSIAYYWLPIVFKPTMDFLARLQFTIQCDVFATLMLLFGIALVANQRFFSPSAISGDTSETDESIIINVRYIQNTIEQIILLFITHITLAIVLTSVEMRLIPILVSLFIWGRIFFWVGYHYNPISRAFGFATTFYPTAIALIYCCYRVINFY